MGGGELREEVIMNIETKMYDDGTLVCIVTFEGGGYSAEISLTKQENVMQIVEKPRKVVGIKSKGDVIEYRRKGGGCGEIRRDGLNFTIDGNGGREVLMGAIAAIERILHPPKKIKRKKPPKEKINPAVEQLNRFLRL